MEAFMFIGIQGSGKSSYFKERFFSTHVRISLDQLKPRHREQCLMDARNALNAYCYWAHRKRGLDEQAATEKIFGLSVGQKNELLFEQGINFNDVSNWQKRGIGLCWEDFDKPSRNPMTGEEVMARRRRIKRDLNLPMKDEYSRFIQSILA